MLEFPTIAAASTDEAFLRYRICCRQKNSPPAHGRRVFDSARQGRKICGIRHKMGDKPSWRRLRAGVYFGESKTRCGHGVLQTVNTRAPRDIPSRAENVWLRSRWRQRCKDLLCKKVRGQARGYRASRQASLAGEQENGGAHSMRAGPGRRINRHDKIITLRLHKTTSIQLRGIGEVRASCDFGIQHEKNGSSSHCDGAGVMRSLSGRASKLPRRGKRIQKMA